MSVLYDQFQHDDLELPCKQQKLSKLPSLILDALFSVFGYLPYRDVFIIHYLSQLHV